VPMPIKMILFALFAIPIFYALGAVIIDAVGYKASYSDGRLLFAFSGFAAFALGKFLFRSSETPDGEADDK
jgi:hypothetical protein